MLVAGGGGGVGGSSSVPLHGGDGGDGGTPVGARGFDGLGVSIPAEQAGKAGCGGVGGKQTLGPEDVHRSDCPNDPEGYTETGHGQLGGSGSGGFGGNSSAGNGSGGGGGGGYFGGAGGNGGSSSGDGSGGGGGGGGSSFAVGTATDVSMSGGSNHGDGKVTVTYGVTVALPSNTAPPTIAGTAREGKTLTEAHGSWTNNPTSFGYQWLVCDGAGNGCAAIADATGQTYAPTAADVGRTIRVQERAVNAGGTGGPATSARTAVVTAAPHPIFVPETMVPPTSSVMPLLPGLPKPACAPPRLKGRSLKAARRVLKKAHCAVGKVRRPKHVKKGRRLVVRKQVKHGQKVNLVLKAVRK